MCRPYQQFRPSLYDAEHEGRGIAPSFEVVTERLFAELFEDLVEALGSTTTIAGCHRLLRGALLLRGAIPVAAVTTPIPVTTTTVATTAVTAPIPPATVPVTATVVGAALATLTGRLGVGKGGPFQRLHQLEADLAPIDLADTDLDLLTVAQVVLDPLDTLGAVET